MNDISNRKERPMSETRQYWVVMSVYERFEQVLALILSAVIAVVIVIALWRLISEVFSLLVVGLFDPFDYEVFQAVFGMIMMLLIAMEFKHSIVKVLYRRAHIIQVKTVILIAQLALARKFIILDLNNTEAMQVFALGFAVLVLAIAHWLLRTRDHALERENAISLPAGKKSSQQEDH
jgi:uncharacterized membrane protein (DUF373 family)